MSSGSVPLMRVALRLTPADAAGWERIAGRLTGSDRKEALERVVRLNSRNSRAWIDLGLQAEERGDLARARQNLQRAAAVDRGYLPLWTLANYQVRHEAGSCFPLLRRALATAVAGAQDANPIFDLAWQTSGDAGRIERELIGEDPERVRLYLTYLVDTGRTEALGGPALCLAHAAAANDRELLLRVCEQMATRDREGEALELWNRMGPAKLDAEHGTVVTNGALKTPSGMGFDWRVNSAPEHALTFDNGVRMEFDGREPDEVDVLSELVPVAAGSSCVLRWEGRGSARAGLIWILRDRGGRKLGAAGIETSREWTRGEARLSIPGGVRFAMLALRLERRTGERRFEGTLSVRHPEMRCGG